MNANQQGWTKREVRGDLPADLIADGWEAAPGMFSRVALGGWQWMRDARRSNGPDFERLYALSPEGKRYEFRTNPDRIRPVDRKDVRLVAVPSFAKASAEAKAMADRMEGDSVSAAKSEAGGFDRTQAARTGGVRKRSRRCRDESVEYYWERY
jgi:hypothetical protein